MLLTYREIAVAVALNHQVF